MSRGMIYTIILQQKFQFYIVGETLVCAAMLFFWDYKWNRYIHEFQNLTFIYIIVFCTDAKHQWKGRWKLRSRLFRIVTEGIDLMKVTFMEQTNNRSINHFFWHLNVKHCPSDRDIPRTPTQAPMWSEEELYDIHGTEISNTNKGLYW